MNVSTLKVALVVICLPAIGTQKLPWQVRSLRVPDQFYGEGNGLPDW